MSEYNENVVKLLGVLKTKPFLFPKTMPHHIHLPRYFEWFEDYNKTEFSQMPAMVHFQPDILDLYKKKIVWTGFAPTDLRGSHAIHTLIQVSKDFHIIFIFAQEDKEVSVIATCYVNNTQDYIKFLTDNEKYIMQENKGMGFAAGFSSITVPTGIKS